MVVDEKPAAVPDDLRRLAEQPAALHQIAVLQLVVAQPERSRPSAL
jgi:hypothetical protein